MSEQPAPTRSGLGSVQIRARLNRLNFTRQQGILGPAEIIALGSSVLILVLVIVSYLYFLLPARLRLEALKAERSGLQSQLRNLSEVVRQGQTTDASVQNITQSLEAFESYGLVGANVGRMSLYDSLNQLIKKNGLRNTSGPTYTPLEPTGSKKGTSGSRSANAKWQSIYPGIAISVTVEGPYPSLRRFVRDIESNKQFVIINSVELERATETDNAPAVTGEPGAATRGSFVSLRLEMATYFQRASEGIAVQPVAR